MKVLSSECPGAVEPLTGFTVGVTAARRREEFGAALERRGAAVLHGPAIRIVPVENDEELRAVTVNCLDHPPDIVVATTGIGFRSWVEAADGWGLADRLLEQMGRAQLLARGPKARGAMRAAGLSGEWSPASESSFEVLEKLLESNPQGKRIVIQQHGEALPDMAEALHAAGAEVVSVQVYRWQPPADPVPLQRMCTAVIERTIDAIAFTSAPAAVSFLQTVEKMGIADGVVDALNRDVLTAAVGPVTAAPLDRAGIRVVQPERARLGSLVREICEELPRHRANALAAAGHRLEIRGQGIVFDGAYVPLSPTGMALLRRLTLHPGQVVPRAALAPMLPGGSVDEHAVGMAIGRLRTAIGDPRVIQTVVKRGYRFAYDPEFGSSGRY